MKPIEALALLGATRVIWIDDQFGNDSVEALAKLLAEHLEISRQLDLQDLEPIFERIDSDDQDARTDLIEMLKETDSEKRTEISRRFHAKSVEANQGTADLDDGQIKCVQEQLNILPADSWPFDHAEKLMYEQAIGNEGDSHITYIVDLQDQYGAPNNERGLDLLRVLGKSNSKATAFLLTRNATKTSEATLEDHLRSKLMEGDDSTSKSPICVIAKERLEGGKPIIIEGLMIAIKRAGLRRGVHEVLLRASSELNDAFNDARTRLLRIPPEQLDHYVVDRAYKEGVSELHVVERALSASMSEKFRTLFATDVQAIDGAARFRKLRPILLDTPNAPSVDLETFRRMELWEDTHLVNASYSLLACGDVFVRSTGAENEVTPDERFILLVQPCDVMLRPSGKRDFDTGILVQIAPRDPTDNNAGSLKKPLLPFILDGKEWVCEFRKAAAVSLAILDTATWRADGRVQYSNADDAAFSPTMLPGQLKNAQKAAKTFEKALTQQATFDSNDSAWFIPSCQLTLSSSNVFLGFASPTFIPKTIPGLGKKDAPKKTGSFSWNLRRVGRVRMPYAAALLSTYLSVQGREAFDLDYLKTVGETPTLGDEQCAPAIQDSESGQIILPLVSVPEPMSTPNIPAARRSGVWDWIRNVCAPK